MDERSARWATGTWLLLCAGLAAVVAFELSWQFAPEVTAAPPPVPLTEPAPVDQRFDPPSRQAFTEIAARPLFSPSRRAFVPEAEVEEEAAPEEKIEIELVGTLLTATGRAALLQPKDQDARWLRAGDEIAGWQVETITSDQVSLTSAGETKTLELRADLVQPAQPRQKPKAKRDQGEAGPDDQRQGQKPDEGTAGDNEQAQQGTE